MKRTLFDAVKDLGDELKPKKPTLRRRTWTRYHHELLNQPLWRRVARLSGAPIERIEAMITRLEVHASSNTPTGYVEDFDISALAAHWNLPTDEPVARIYAALEEAGWIEQGQIATYWGRNPDEEGEELERRRRTDAERQAKRRAKKRAEKEAARQALGYPRSRDAHVTRVTVTPRADLSDKHNAGVTVENSGAAVCGEEAAVQGSSGQSGDNPAQFATSPELWLVIEGKRIVTERLKAQPLLAETQIERWKRELAGNALALADIIRGAAAAGYSELKFRMEVEAAIARWPHQAQRQLALPVSLKGAGNG